MKEIETDNNVVRKTPEEIKKGLECCCKGNACRGHCPYDGPENGIKGCTGKLSRDALDYIQQLEAENFSMSLKLAQFAELRSRIRKVGADAYLRLSEPISPTSEDRGKQQAVRSIADLLYQKGAIRFHKWLCGEEVVLSGELQIVKPEPPKEE